MFTLLSDSKRRWAAFLLAVFICFGTLCDTQATSLKNRYFVDFDFIRQIAPDAVAWLYRPDETFNVPVVYSKDSQHYLNHRYDGIKHHHGSLFFTGDTAPDFSEPVLLMHGYNATDDHLFGSFYLYRRNEDYYEQHPSLYLYTPNGAYQLDIFAGIRTNQGDDYTWTVPDDETRRMEMLPGILERSFLTPLPDSLPQEGDQWLLMTAEGKKPENTRYVLYTRMRPLEQTEELPAVELNQMEMDRRETQNGTFTVEGLGEYMIYGQNDPSWDRLIFETTYSSRKRPFGDGGCGPTAVALALANLLEPEDLLKINDYSPDPYGYTICSCSITQHFCHQYHLPYHIDTAEEMLRYFPLVIGSFATGYNTLDVQGRYDSFGSNMDYLEALCTQVYGLPYETTTDKDVAFNFLKERKGIAITCTLADSPFTSRSHYITMAAADDTYLYVLDPLRRESYGDLDPHEKLDILTPGLVRMKIADAYNISMFPIFMISYPEK